MKTVKLASCSRNSKWFSMEGSYDLEEVKNYKELLNIRENIDMLQDPNHGIQWLAKDRVCEA